MNRICKIFGIQYPVVQGGMVWCSGWRLASAVSNAGGLGLLGAGSMHPGTLLEHIRKCRAATDQPFGVNIPLMYPEIEQIMDIIVSEQVKIVFTSAGNPKAWTGFLKNHGVKVAHVVSSSRFAAKSEDAGVDAIVAEGFEAGGHNGREETTTLCLIPAVRRVTTLPLLAAGGIGTGEAMLAAEVLGADGVQIGTRFALTKESSAHEDFKQYCLNLEEGDTRLLLKKLSPTRLVKGDFMTAVEAVESRGASAEELRALLGKSRAKKGVFEGDLNEGLLEIGQIASLFHRSETVDEVMTGLIESYKKARSRLL
ncbi:MAG: nitronate monooxygenase [Tannerella sp.]|jgi:enoyl-[acyl-carrier protein] reductase II|nr:nitronate monooxygenase [Tannerella sp.]